MAKSKQLNNPVEFDWKAEGIEGDVTLADLVEHSMYEYGTEVIEGRALLDYRDGLIPLYRRILWSMWRDKMWPTGGTRKSARVVGNVMGIYHPHGDGAIYGGLVTMANQSYSCIDKQGNFGNLLDPPAAMRYTECRLSPFAVANVLDPYMMNVVERLPTYDGGDTEPLLLIPSIPVALLYGATGIAVGVTTDVPSFTAESLAKLVRMAMQRSIQANRWVHLTGADCAQVLEFYDMRGGSVTSDLQEITNFFNDKQGTIEWTADYEWSDERHAVIVTGFPRDLAFEKLADRLNTWPEIKIARFANDGNKNINARKQRLEIELVRGSASEVEAAYERVCAQLTCKSHYKCNFTERYVVDRDGVQQARARFFSMSVPNLIDYWIQWRVQQQDRALRFEWQECEEQRIREDLVRRALDLLDEMAAMAKRTRVDPHFDSVAALAARMGCTPEQSRMLWDIPLGRFRRLSVEEQQKKLDRLVARLAQITSDLQNTFAVTGRWLAEHTTI